MAYCALFGKLNGGQVSAWRAFWMIVGVLAWLGVSCLSGVLGNAAVWVTQQSPLGVSGYWLGWVGAWVNLLVLVGSVAFSGGSSWRPGAPACRGCSTC